jgi:hypothetical protein
MRMANNMGINKLTSIRKLALGIISVFYLVGGYGVAGSLFSVGFAAWEVVLVLALWTGLFGLFGWGVFHVGASEE